MKSTDPTAYSPLKYLALDMHCTLKFYTIIYMYAMVAHLPPVECRIVVVVPCAWEYMYCKYVENMHILESQFFSLKNYFLKQNMASLVQRTSLCLFYIIYRTLFLFITLIWLRSTINYSPINLKVRF